MARVSGQSETSSNPDTSYQFASNSATDYQALWQLQKGENDRLRLSLATLEDKTANADRWEKDAKDYKHKYFGSKTDNARMRDKLHDVHANLDKCRRTTRSTIVSEEGDELTVDFETQLEQAQNALKEEESQVRNLKQRCREWSYALDDARRSQNRNDILQKENDFQAEMDELKESLAESTALLTEKSEATAQMSDVLDAQNVEITTLRESVAHKESEAGKSRELVESLENDKAALLQALQVAKGHINELFKEAEDAHHAIDTYGDPKELREELAKTEEKLLISDATSQARQSAHLEALEEVNAVEEKFAQKSLDLTELKMEVEKYSEEHARDAKSFAVKQSEMKEDNEMLRTSLRVQTGLIVELERERDAFQLEFQEMETIKNDAQMQLVQEVQQLRRSLSAGDPTKLLEANSELKDNAAMLHLGKEERDEELQKLQEKVEFLQMTVQVTEAERDYLHSMHQEHAATLKHAAQLEQDYGTLENDLCAEISKSEAERKEFLQQLDLLEREKQRVERVSISTSNQLLQSQDEQQKAESHLRSLYALIENKTESSAKLLEAFGNEDMNYLDKLGHLETTMDKLLNHAEEREELARENESLLRKVEVLESKHYTALKDLEDQHELRVKVDNLTKALESRSSSDASLSMRSELVACENQCRTSKSETLQKRVKRMPEKSQQPGKEAVETDAQTDSQSRSSPERDPSSPQSKKLTDRTSELQCICSKKLEKLKKERALFPFSSSRGRRLLRGLSAPPLRNVPRSHRPSVGFSFPSSPVSFSSRTHTVIFGGRQSPRASLRASARSTKTNSPINLRARQHSDASLTVRSSPGSLECLRSAFNPPLSFRASFTPQPLARCRIVGQDIGVTPIPIPRPPQQAVGAPFYPFSRPSGPSDHVIALSTTTPVNAHPPFPHPAEHLPDSFPKARPHGSQSPCVPARVSMRTGGHTCSESRLLPVDAHWSREMSPDVLVRLPVEGITSHVLLEKAPPRLRPSAKLKTPVVFSAIRVNSATRKQNNDATVHSSTQDGRPRSPQSNTALSMPSVQMPLRRTIAIGTGSALRRTVGGLPPPMTLYPVLRQNSAPHTPRTEGTTMPSPVLRAGVPGVPMKSHQVLGRSQSLTQLFQFPFPPTYSTPCSTPNSWHSLVPHGTLNNTHSPCLRAPSYCPPSRA